MSCPYEIETIRASHDGSPSPELLMHQKSCAHCREALQLAAMLSQDASRLREEAVLPSASHVWVSAERRWQAVKLARAAAVLRILKISALVYAVAFAFWVAHAFANFHGGLMQSGLNGKALSASIEGASIAVLCVGIGLSYTLRQDRRTRTDLRN